MALGVSGEGVADPLQVHVKASRAGLGVEETHRRKKEKAAARKAAQETETVDHFRSRQQSQYTERKLSGQLRHALRVCYELDSTAGIVAAFYKTAEEFTEEEKEEAAQHALMIEREEFAEQPL